MQVQRSCHTGWLLPPPQCRHPGDGQGRGGTQTAQEGSCSGAFQENQQLGSSRWSGGRARPCRVPPVSVTPSCRPPAVATGRKSRPGANPEKPPGCQ